MLAISLVLTLIAGLIGESLNFLIDSEDSILFIIITMTLNRIGNISMFLTWFIARKLFDDSIEFPKVHIGVWALAISSIVARSIGSYCAHFAIELSVFAYLVTWGYSQLVLLGFLIAAIFIAIKGFSNDLVVERRQERVIFIFCVASLLLVMVGNRGVWVWGAITEGVARAVVPLPTELYSVYAYCILVGLFLWKFRLVNLSVIQDPGVESQNVDNDVQLGHERELINKIKACMKQEKVFLEAGLTVSDLAAQVGSQEYLVRRAINNRMGYKNFSEFLNYYRINESIRLLADSDDPITAIGFGVGYGSLSSFYKAFKNVHGVTPKHYRALHNANS